MLKLIRWKTIMFAVWLSILSLSLASAQEYVPGTPGGPWTHDEVMTVKSKLFSIFNNGGGTALNQLYGGNSHGANWMDTPNAAKMLRLGFHDCLKYTDGTGGCDGCLNWEGMGFRFDDAPNQFKYENVGLTNNNGLKFTVEVLEAIYTDPAFPAVMAPALNASLKSSGKSRADLWALAAIAAVEHGIQTTNLVCDENYNENPGKQCNAFIGTENCHVHLEEPIRFETGRADCTEFGEQPYMATKEEVHPNAVGNGKMTADFFQDNFGFTGRETVAIMGAHTMGRLHVAVSLFRYLWGTREQHQFNNVYYRNIIREPKYSWFDGKCTRAHDAEGNIPRRRWVAHVRKDTKNGGPVHWISENYQCKDLCKTDEHNCCLDVGVCKADSVLMEDDPNINGGCEKFSFISGLDEMALPSEIGLYFDFEVTDDGVPYGCPGFEQFTPTHWNQSYANTWSSIVNPNGGVVKADPECGMNKLEYPEGSTPLHEIFEEYAADQNKFVQDFIRAFEKMLSNGYETLSLGPDQFTDVICNRAEKWGGWKYTNCYLEDEINTERQFSLISRADGRAISGQYHENAAWTAVMKTFNASDPAQKWVVSKYGNQLINVATNQPLVTSQGKSWIWDGEINALRDARQQEKALGRQDPQEDGTAIYTAPYPSINAFWIPFPFAVSANLSQPHVKIVSKLDNRVMEGLPNGGAVMMTAGNSTAQAWTRYAFESGEVYMNVATQLPLFVQFNEVWNYTDSETLVSMNGDPKAIDRGWTQEDGQGVNWFNEHGAPNQQFVFEPIDLSDMPM